MNNEYKVFDHYTKLSLALNFCLTCLLYIILFDVIYNIIPYSQSLFDPINSVISIMCPSTAMTILMTPILLILGVIMLIIGTIMIAVYISVLLYCTELSIKTIIGLIRLFLNISI